MSITSYTELQSAITRWLARDDLAANIPDYIMLFEQVANRRLRTLSQEVNVSLTTTGGFATLPTDYLAWREVHLNSNPFLPLEYMTPAVLGFNFPTLPTGDGRAFTILGTQIHVEPHDNAITMLYFQEIPPLSVSSGTNWLLQEYPDLYLFGSLYHAYEFMLDLQNAAFRKAQRDEIFDEVQTLSNKTRGVGGMRLVGMATP
jgi:hypothetical protein